MPQSEAAVRGQPIPAQGEARVSPVDGDAGRTGFPSIAGRPGAGYLGRGVHPARAAPGEGRIAEAMDALDAVLDPELDESVVALGFIAGVEIDGDRVAVSFRLPTFWCAPNFAWIMAEDMRLALSRLSWARNPEVRLVDHLFAEKINAAVNAGTDFGATFDDAGGNLAELRRTFRRKAFLGRMSDLIADLRAGGRDDDTILSLTVGELASMTGEPLPATSLRGEAVLPRRIARYLELRTAFGGPSGPDDPAFRTAEGEGLTAASLPAFLRGARMTRRSTEANGEFCRVLLSARGYLAPKTRTGNDGRESQ